MARGRPPGTNRPGAAHGRRSPAPAPRSGLALVVLHQLTRHRGTERRLPRLQRHPHLGARLGVVAGAGQGEHAVGGVPELLEGDAEQFTLLRRAAGDADFFLAPQGVVEIAAEAVELRRPGVERIAGLAVEHVAHRQAELIQIVLNPEQLQGIAAVAVGEIVLEVAQLRDLARQIPGIGGHRGQRDDEPEQEGRRR
jgi:hypothetical protein